MTRPGASLAERLKEILDEREVSRARADEDRGERLAAGRAAREALFDDLAAFAEAVGHFDAIRHDEGVVLTFEGRELHFEAKGLGDRVVVRFAAAERRGEENHVYREGALNERWVWVRTRGAYEDRTPLFDAGLEALLVAALHTPVVNEEEDDEPPMSPRLARALTNPGSIEPALDPIKDAAEVVDEAEGGGALPGLGEERRRTL